MSDFGDGYGDGRNGCGDNATAAALPPCSRGRSQPLATPCSCGVFARHPGNLFRVTVLMLVVAAGGIE